PYANAAGWRDAGRACARSGEVEVYGIHPNAGSERAVVESATARRELLERLDLDDRGAVVAADPERAGTLRVVHVDTADVGRARQHVFGVLAALDVEARHAVGQHRAGPRLAVAAGHGVVRRAPRRRHLPLRDALRLRIEHADGIALILGEPQPSLVIDASAPRSRVRRRRLEHACLQGLGVEPDDVAGGKVEQVRVVLRVRVNAVGPDALAGARILERAEVLHLVGEEVETIDMTGGGVLDPHLVVAMGALDREMAELARVAVPLLRRRPHLELPGLAVELRDRALVHHADPGVVVAVDLQVEGPLRPARLDHGDRILRHASGLLIHLPEEHLAEVRVPDVALAIEHDVVRLDERAWQVVLGEDHAGGLALEPRLGLQGEGPGLLLAQVDAGEPFCSLPAAAAALDVARRGAGEPLRLERSAAGIVAGHALEDLHEALRVVRRLHDPLERVATIAVEQEPLLLVRARHARHPFGVGELRGQVARLLEPDVGLGLPIRRNVRSPGCVELVARGARLQRIAPGLEPRGRKRKVALRVGDDADGDRRAVSLGADDHAFD